MMIYQFVKYYCSHQSFISIQTIEATLKSEFQITRLKWFALKVTNLKSEFAVIIE
jgi:hypothetical protein